MPHPLEPTITPPTSPTAADAMIPPDLQISDHTSIDRALDVLRGSHSQYVLIRDDTGRCAGIVTRDQLTALGAKPWYAENTRVRDIAHDHSPFARPGMPASEAAAAMRERSLTVLPVVDEEGFAVGILTTERLQTLLGTASQDTQEQP
ncbi:CBS domain-containing protein [Streptomyces virginiae]|nr:MULTISPECIES: CBS domain-containing protein [Streptomyces]MCX4718165.1 CBS domain-containing protein [Streptomyces virginiae]WSR18764.1 CBS domain-containing protein [Streptomyces sp. NBC_01207]WSX97014.1 CBS domain-containing protein [Streptomyces goshikiensis]